jgi:prephenate dehydrogenase
MTRMSLVYNKMTLITAYPRVVICGLGLIGGSLAACFSQQGVPVVGVSRDSATLQQAQDNGFIQLGFKDLRSAVADAADQAEAVWVFLCGPLSVNRQWLQQISTGLPSHVCVTDVGSCKRRIVSLAQTVLPRQFVGGHPMAGKAVGGLDHAVPLLFHQRAYVLCPNPQLPAEAFQQLQTLVSLTGSQLKLMDADTHDKMVAWVSHVPQLYSYALADSLAQTWADTALVHGPALTEHLRISASPHDIWQDIFAENGDYIALAWQQVTQQGQQNLTTMTGLE